MTTITAAFAPSTPALGFNRISDVFAVVLGVLAVAFVVAGFAASAPAFFALGLASALAGVAKFFQATVEELQV
ncbi:MAG: hypothetical protein Q4G51_12390 [Dermatophilus congolensis]|nr:hypothetical protein [Dermatophilus congolensis]